MSEATCHRSPAASKPRQPTHQRRHERRRKVTGLTRKLAGFTSNQHRRLFVVRSVKHYYESSSRISAALARTVLINPKKKVQSESECRACRGCRRRPRARLRTHTCTPARVALGTFVQAEPPPGMGNRVEKGLRACMCDGSVAWLAWCEAWVVAAACAHVFACIDACVCRASVRA